ncbi:AraC family transcriptional regulator [Actinorhabdospora filicis]|uniref:AraC family transcriptional regulator n=1 Tax=Actinorhabdospora filicis TaxID=1785913 RepID=A0A9W6W2D1_9ACTN|nr:helix-turn-helix domain-containing protein [Actinorhabdospora filicis]GLZ76882.1 AraC family transcriptional regulator [Actinorhabdospora filicis]
MYRERPVPGGVLWERAPVAAAGPQVILPDGSMDLIWTGGRLIVAGPDSRAQYATGAPGASYTGVRFDPGLAPLVLGVPAVELRDARVAAEDVFDAGDLIARLEYGEDPAEVLGAVPTPPADRLIAAVVSRARAGEGVAAIAGAVNLGERQLHRRALASFGYGVKTLGRIFRMTRALDLARGGVAYAEAAARAGYADQAHLARDVRGLAGTTMGALLS